MLVQFFTEVLSILYNGIFTFCGGGFKALKYNSNHDHIERFSADFLPLESGKYSGSTTRYPYRSFSTTATVD